ncbi:unnamed protein product, partial [Didymodactylos carnosus]
WSMTSYTRERVQQGAHNIGISGDTSGHFYMSKNTFIAYAYQLDGSSGANWPTLLNPVTLAKVPMGSPVDEKVSSIFNMTECLLNQLFAPFSYGSLNGYEFPIDFTIQSLVTMDGSVWQNVLGQNITNFPNPGNQSVHRPFLVLSYARWFRILATKLGKDNHGNSYFQLAELATSVLY